MPVSGKLVRVFPIALLLAVMAFPARAGAPQPTPSSSSAKSTEDGEVEVKYIDNSNMKLKLLDDKLELVTKHGVLRIAVADIRRIEFATRVPTGMAEKIQATIAKLNNSDFKVREAATEELKRYRARAYPQLLKAMKNEDPEVSQRAELVVKFIRNHVSAAFLEVRDQDVVHTDDSKIAGRLTAEYLRVGTFQFGEQRLKLQDIHLLHTGLVVEDRIATIPGPTHLAAYQNQFGKELVFSVTGVAAGVRGNVWGTDVYTLDSHLPSAVVHAGLAKPGETVTVRVRIIQSPAQFTSSSRNGVITANYGLYPTGAYEFVRK